jgi:hypothetical protein
VPAEEHSDEFLVYALLWMAMACGFLIAAQEVYHYPCRASLAAVTASCAALGTVADRRRLITRASSE